MITISTSQIKRHRPCLSEWSSLLLKLGQDEANDEQIPASAMLDHVDLDNALWGLRCLPEYDRLWRLFGLWCAKQVEDLMDDERSRHALKVVERFVMGKASRQELAAARAAARAAAWDARDARAAAWAARSAADWVAKAADWAAARSAADWAAWAAGDAARATQKKQLRKLLDTETIEIGGYLYYIKE